MAGHLRKHTLTGDTDHDSSGLIDGQLLYIKNPIDGIQSNGVYSDEFGGLTANTINVSTLSATTYLNLPSSVPSGSGTTNYIAKWSAGTILENSQIYDDGANVGIGLIGTSASLHIKGAGNTNATHSLKVENLTGNLSLQVTDDGSVFNWGGGSGNTSNTAFGTLSLFALTTGAYNTAFGNQTLKQNSTGLMNTAFGTEALPTNTTGNYNTAVGRSSLALSNSDYNTAIGSYALFSTNSGVENTSLGAACLFNNTTGSDNVGIGLATLRENTTGSQNTGLGTRAGFNNQTGSANVFLGFNSGYYETGSNKLYIDNNSRTDLSTSKTNSLIYGVFDSSPSAQTLTINAQLSATTLSPNSPITTVTGSTSGNAEFSEPFQGNNYKKVIIYCNALDGTASYVFPVPFIYTPYNMGPAILSSLTTTGVTVSTTTTSTFIILEGY